MKVALMLLLCILLWGNIRGNGLEGQIIRDVGGRFPHDRMVIYLRGENGRPQDQLSRSNFKLYLNEEPVDSFEIRPYLASPDSIAILFCVDVSGSMAGQPIQMVQQSLQLFLNRLPSQTQVALTTIGDSFKVIQPFQPQPQRLYSRVEKIQARAKTTELFYSIYKSLELFRHPKLPDLRFFVLFSDGKNEGSRAYTIDDCVELARNTSVICETIGFSRVDPVYLKNLEKLADLTGGEFLAPREPGRIPAAYQTLQQFLNSYYILSFNLESLPAGETGPLRVLVTTDEGNLTLISGRSVSVPYAFPIWAIILSGVLVFLVLIIALLWYFRHKKNLRRVQGEFEKEKRSLLAKLTGFRRNLDYVQQELAQREETAPPVEVPAMEATQVLELGGEPNYFLKIIEGEFTDSLMQLTAFPATIGKRPDCDIRLSDPTVSRIHARLEKQNGQIFIYDQNSTNGVRVNGKFVKKTPLKSGDIISLGNLKCRFEVL